MYDHTPRWWPVRSSSSVRQHFRFALITHLVFGSSPPRSIAKLHESNWFNATGLADEIPEMVEFSARIAAIVSAGHAHAAAGAGRRNGNSEPVHDCKDILAIERRKRDATRRQF